MITLRFLPSPEPCCVCGLPTVTIKFGKGMRLPMHVGCDRRAYSEHDAPEVVVDALTILATTFGPLRLNPPEPVWEPDEVGPCVRCRRPTRRYGTHARTLCPRCSGIPANYRRNDDLEDPN